MEGVQGVITVKVNLIKRRAQVYRICPVCGQEEETIFHALSIVLSLRKFGLPIFYL